MNDSIISPAVLQVARRRAARGRDWLDRRAKYDPRFLGWRLQMMNIFGGRVFSVVTMQYNTNDPISLVLKHDTSLACESDGRVKWATVAPAFGFETKTGCMKAVYLGFNEGNLDPTWEVRDIMEYCHALNQAWAEVLDEHRTEEAPRLYPHVDRLDEAKPKGFLETVVDWLRSLGKRRNPAYA